MTTRGKAAPAKPGRRTAPKKIPSADARRAGARPRPAPQAPSAATPPGDAGAGQSDEPGRPPVALTRVQAIRELADRANRGSASALAQLRRLLDNCPEIWEVVGDLARHAELAWLALVAGEDRLMHESVKRHVARMKDDLRGPHPTPMERLFVDQAAACYLAAQHAETCLAAPGSCSAVQAALRLRRAESAQRRFLAAFKTLARLRATAPQGMAPLNPLQLHTGERQQA